MGSLWNRSGIVERHADDVRAAGALAYFYQGGTTTPWTVFQDAAEGSAHSNPVVADADGRWPNVFVPYIVGYDVRVTSAQGTLISFTQQIPNPNPIEISTTTPLESQVQTGMIHGELTAGTKAGYVRLNGRTLGNATSGATERANADTANLFAYLWNNLANGQAPVSGGRSGSAASDFAANKTITLPDLRGTALFGLDDMGNTAIGNFPGDATFYTGNATTPGSWCGNNQSSILNAASLPAHTHGGTTSTVANHSHGGVTAGEAGHTHGGTTDAEASHTHDGSSISVGNTDLTHHHTYDKPSIGTVQSGAGAGVSTSTTVATSTTDALGNHTHGLSGSTGAGSAHAHSFTTGAGSAHSHGISADGSHSHTFTTGSTGSSAAFATMPFARLVTWFIKL